MRDLRSLDERRCKKGPEHYYSKVQFALLSPVLEEQGKKKEKRPDYKCHRAGTSQVGLKMTERATRSRMEGGTCPHRDWSGNAECSRGMQTRAGRTWVLILDLRSLQRAEGDMGWTPFMSDIFYLLNSD